MSIGYMSGPLCGMPDGITSNTQMATESLPQLNGKTNPIYVSAFMGTHGFLMWIRARFTVGSQPRG